MIERVSLFQKGGGDMAVLAKPGKNMIVLKVDNRNDFIKKFNQCMPSKKTIEVAKKTNKLFKWK